MLGLILLVFAFVFFVLAGFSVPPATGRFNLIGLGLACWVMADMVGKWPAVGR
jgi:hypothetical protein